jgi:hypothetical protein
VSETLDPTLEDIVMRVKPPELKHIVCCRESPPMVALCGAVRDQPAVLGFPPDGCIVCAHMIQKYARGMCIRDGKPCGDA